MNLKKSFWKVATVIAVGLMVLNPETIAFGLFIDAVGLDIFVLLVEIQVIVGTGYYFRNCVKPALNRVYEFIQRHDPYFFIPTRKIVAEYPPILCHAIPCFVSFALTATLVSN